MMLGLHENNARSYGNLHSGHSGVCCVCIRCTCTNGESLLVAVNEGFPQTEGNGGFLV